MQFRRRRYAQIDELRYKSETKVARIDSDHFMWIYKIGGCVISSFVASFLSSIYNCQCIAFGKWYFICFVFRFHLL